MSWKFKTFILDRGLILMNFYTASKYPIMRTVWNGRHISYKSAPGDVWQTGRKLYNSLRDNKYCRSVGLVGLLLICLLKWGASICQRSLELSHRHPEIHPVVQFQLFCREAKLYIPTLTYTNFWSFPSFYFFFSFMSCFFVFLCDVRCPEFWSKHFIFWCQSFIMHPVRKRP